MKSLINIISEMYLYKHVSNFEILGTNYCLSCQVYHSFQMLKVTTYDQRCSNDSLRPKFMKFIRGLTESKTSNNELQSYWIQGFNLNILGLVNIGLGHE